MIKLRKAELVRKTKETDISLELNIDGKGLLNIETGIGFFNHMLEALGKHGFFDMTIRSQGDLHVDQHHSVEDVGIVLGKAVKAALGDKHGITRYATVYTPMDEALSMVALDICGRAYLHYDVFLDHPVTGSFDATLVEEFFRAFANNAEVTLHINKQYGRNTHHIIESIFKGVGRALDIATQVQERIEHVISTKGVL